MIYQTEAQFIDIENVSNLQQFQCYVTVDTHTGDEPLVLLLLDVEIADYIGRNLGYYSDVFVTYSIGESPSTLEPKLLEIHRS
jgi:hypothetical protein